MRGCLTVSVGPLSSSVLNNPHGWPKLAMKLAFSGTKEDSDANRETEVGVTGDCDCVSRFPLLDSFWKGGDLTAGEYLPSFNGATGEEVGELAK